MSAPATSPMLEAALAYAAAGLRVLPFHETREGVCSCKLGSKCRNAGKHPRVRGHENVATTDPETIRQWWRRWPTANVGHWLRASEPLVAIDVDVPSPAKPDKKDGAQAMRELLSGLALNLKAFPTYSSPSGGFRIFGRVPEELAGMGKLPAPCEGVDMFGALGDSHANVLPPSRNGSGVYEWRGSFSAEDLELDALPALPSQLWARASNGRPSVEDEERAAIQDEEPPRGLPVSEFREAVKLWNAAHPGNYPKDASECPSCGSPDGFKALATDPTRWVCHSTRHGEEHAGRKGDRCYHGSELDLEAERRKTSTMRVLRSDGYLEERREKPKPRPILRRLADVEREDVTFLWEPYVPRGKITIFQGLPEAAKTMTACWLAARISTGTVPGAPAAPANVLFLIAEDGLEDTIRPRCESMGADLSRIYVLEEQWIEKDGRDQPQPIYFTDLELLEEVLAEVKPAALIADPIQAFLGADVDMHRANETRPVLSGLKRLADKARCAVVLVGHFRKGGGGQVMERTLGSIDIAGAARSILSFGKDPNDGDARHALHTKSNLAKAGHGLLFRWGPDHVYGYAGESTMTAEILFAAPGRPPTKIHDAQDFLREILAAGPLPSAKVEQEATRAGISKRTLMRAREELGVVARKADFGTGWVLRLPDPGDVL